MDFFIFANNKTNTCRLEQGRDASPDVRGLESRLLGRWRRWRQLHKSVVKPRKSFFKMLFEIRVIDKVRRVRKASGCTSYYICLVRLYIYIYKIHEHNTYASNRNYIMHIFFILRVLGPDTPMRRGRLVFHRRNGNGSSTP